MHSLYHALLAQHSRQVTPVRCARQTIAQLHTYFEDVVLENNLAALVIESLPLMIERPLREIARVREVGRAARHCFFFVDPQDQLIANSRRNVEHERGATFITRPEQHTIVERFVVIADARFSALLASVSTPDATDGSDDVIWTFEPDVVYSALEYLMARVTAERPMQAASFAIAVGKCMPKATSLQLTVSVTTKLARLLQEQAGREVAVGRIATAIRSSLELPSILQTTVDETGRALGAQGCALRVESASPETPEETLTHCYFRDDATQEYESAELEGDLHAINTRLLAGRLRDYVVDGCAGSKSLGAYVMSAADSAQAIHPMYAVPLFYDERFMGTLMVRSDDSTRVWQESEKLLMRTVADQVTVAVNHARLFKAMQQQALTDALTGCVNRRSFEMQLERDLQLAMRNRQPLSLVMFDIDHFKQVNDTFGHVAGDVALRTLADVVRRELRGIDTAARYGGEEFAIILPQANVDGALIVADRLRACIAATDIAGVGKLTASFGVATFPLHATNRAELIAIADDALYDAKRTGRNRVSVHGDATLSVTDEMFDNVEVITTMHEPHTTATPVFN
jgi:diguanylate cyclase (GGDEF)-like protein